MSQHFSRSEAVDAGTGTVQVAKTAFGIHGPDHVLCRFNQFTVVAFCFMLPVFQPLAPGNIGHHAGEEGVAANHHVADVH